MSCRPVLALPSVFLLAACLWPADPKLPAPRRVTLHGDKLPLKQALAQLAQQTGITVQDRGGDPDRALHIDVKKVSFWQALDTLTAAAGRRVYLYPSSGRIALDRVGAGYHRPPVSYDGRFRCVVQRVSAARDLESGRVVYTATLEVAWEPQLLPLYLETRPQRLRVQDDKGNPLPAGEEGSSLAPVNGLIALTIDARLPALPRTCGKIGLLAGELSVVAPSKMLAFDFGSLAELGKAEANRRQEREKVVCQIGKPTLTEDRWTVRVTLDYPPGGKQLDSFQSWVVHNQLILQTKDGKKRLSSTDYLLESSTPRHAVLSYHFRDKDGQTRGKAEDWNVLYRTPAAIIEVPFRFSFQNVPLP